VLKRHIVAAAVQLAYGSVFSLPSPARHHDIMRACGELILPHRQGFIDDEGEFLHRDEACVVAEKADQLNKVRNKTFPLNQLFSEDLW